MNFKQIKKFFSFIFYNLDQSGKAGGQVSGCHQMQKPS